MKANTATAPSMASRIAESRMSRVPGPVRDGEDADSITLRVHGSLSSVCRFWAVVRTDSRAGRTMLLYRLEVVTSIARVPGMDRTETVTGGDPACLSVSPDPISSTYVPAVPDRSNESSTLERSAGDCA